jgi:peptide/nickel transport system substrate-binding protein
MLGAASVWFLVISVCCLAALSRVELAAEEPQYGGTLRVAILGEVAHFDPHQDETFALMMTAAPVYNTLLQFSPTEYPQIIGDLAESWTVSEDGLTYTFTLHQGVQFHDESELTGADVKASYEKIIWPPQGVESPRQAMFQALESITVPEPYTVVFTLKRPAASMLSHLASPWNVIYPKKYLDQDRNYFKTHMLGSGPFKLKSYVPGKGLEVEKNPHYWVQERPYLDGVTFLFFKELSEITKALRTEQVDIEFRSLPPAEVEALRKQKGRELNVQSPGWITFWGVAPNLSRPPMNDERVRKALSLAMNRYDMARTLAPLTGLGGVGGLVRPGTPWALDAEELARLPGYGQDIEASRAEARRLLADAGYNEDNPLKVVLKNRNVKLYIDFGRAVIAAWQRIGVQAEHRLEDTATWSASEKKRDFELLVISASDYVDDPDIQLSRWLTNSARNYPGLSDPAYDQLFEQQSQTLDAQQRVAMVKDMQRLLLGKAFFIQGLWSSRMVVYAARVQNYGAHPSHYTNQRLQDVWLAR